MPSLFKDGVMHPDEIEIGKIYEYRKGQKVTPFLVRDRIQDHGFLCQNLDTKRENTIKFSDVPNRFAKQIVNMSEWRLHNGD